MTANLAAGICQKIPHRLTVNFLLLKPIYSHLHSLSRSQYSHIVTAVGHMTHLYLLRSPITSSVLWMEELAFVLLQDAERLMYACLPRALGTGWRVRSTATLDT